MADHVVINGASDPGQLECMNCGATYVPSMPCSINTYIAILDSFGGDHEGCEYREEGRLGTAQRPTEKCGEARE